MKSHRYKVSNQQMGSLLSEDLNLSQGDPTSVGENTWPHKCKMVHSLLDVCLPIKHPTIQWNGIPRELEFSHKVKIARANIWKSCLCFANL